MDLPDLPRFYIDQDTLGYTAVIDGDELKHARVLRIQDGDSIHLINGRGKLYQGLARPGKKEMKVDSIIEVMNVLPESNSSVTLYIAPTKNSSRLEWVIEKAAEVGVDRIVPIWTERTGRGKLRVDRLERIAVSAAKQSKSLWFMAIEEPRGFEEAISSVKGEAWIAHCMDQLNKTDLITWSTSQSSSCSIFIGPEGDFTLEEVSFAEKNGMKGLDLGPKRLRTETAAVVAITIAALLRRKL